MSRQSLIYFTFSALLLGSVLLERHALLQIRSENQVLRAQGEEQQRLELEQQELPRLKSQLTPLESAREANRDLPKLRNEVRQLRQQETTLLTLRGYNEQFRKELSTNHPAKPAGPAGQHP